jgi:SAM-dependent methyltransferase
VVLIVLHIPGTGGAALEGLALRQFRSREVYLLRGEDSAESERALASLPEFAGEPSLVASTASFGVHRYVADGRYVTLFRDPGPRVISEYCHARCSNRHPMHAIANKMTLSEVLEADAWRDLSNGHCRALTGRWEFSTYAQPNQVLTLAIDNLERHFALWGLTERFPETRLIAKATLGWRRVALAPRPAVHRTSVEGVSDADLDAVNRYNVLDIALRGELEERFQRRLVEVLPDWQRQLVSLRAADVAARPARWLQRRSEERTSVPTAAAPQRCGGGPASDSAAQTSDARSPSDVAQRGADESLRRWIVGGYDWQVGRNEGRCRRIAGEYNWSRIETSFPFLEKLLLPCAELGDDAAYDVGCGAGLVSFGLLGHFARVVGIDSDIRAIARARALAGVAAITRARFVHGDVAAFHPHGPFNLVLCNMMSHNVEGRLALLQHLASATQAGGWLIYAEVAEGYAPLEIESALAERNVHALRARLRQVLSGVIGDASFRFFVAPTVSGPLKSLGFDVVEEDMTWWRSLPVSHRLWCRKRSEGVVCATFGDRDYEEVPANLRQLRSRVHELLGARRVRNGTLSLTSDDERWMAAADNELAPLLLLIEMASDVLPTGSLEQIGGLLPGARRAMDAATSHWVDWPRVEETFARFCALVDARGTKMVVAGLSRVGS